MIASRVWASETGPMRLTRVAVGAAMAQRVDHSLSGVGPRGAGRIEDGADAAHAPHLGRGLPLSAYLSHPRLEPCAGSAQHRPLASIDSEVDMYRFIGLVHAKLLRAGQALRESRGQGTVEYVALILLVALVMAGVVAAMKGFRTGQGKELGDVIVGKIKEAVKKVQF